jgi:hypothetical protein
MKRVVLIGLDPATVNFSDPALPPGMTAKAVRPRYSNNHTRRTSRPSVLVLQHLSNPIQQKNGLQGAPTAKARKLSFTKMAPPFA